jgi:hypothetical protein
MNKNYDRKMFGKKIVFKKHAREKKLIAFIFLLFMLSSLQPMGDFGGLNSAKLGLDRLPQSA